MSIMKSLVVVSLLLATVVAAPFNREAFMRDVEQGFAPMPIVDTLRSEGLTTLVDLIDFAGLTDTLNDHGASFTVLAPTNEGLMEIPKFIVTNKTAVTKLLMYHVIQGKVMSSMLKDNLMAASLRTGLSVRINYYQNWQYSLFTANGVTIEEADKMASNGVIHVLGRPLLPVPTDNVIMAMEKIGGLSITLDLIKMAGLDKALAGMGPFTVLAPMNSGWEDKNITSLSKNITLLTEILKYHVMPGVVYTTNTDPDALLPTLAGRKLIYSPNSDSGTTINRVNSVRVKVADMTVSNGVLWMLEEPLPEPIFI